MHSERSVTSHDVARLAGVSQPTVSRALRDEPGVSATTRARIRSAVRALEYVPSAAARSLVTKTTRRVGIVVAELANPFFSSLVGPLHDALGAVGYRTILITDGGDSPLEMGPLIDGSLDGVLLTTSEAGAHAPLELARRGVPFVMVDRVVEGVVADSCSVDNGAGAMAAAELLASLGHRRIGAIFGPDSTSTGNIRATAFRETLAARGIALRPHVVRSGAFEFATGFEAMHELAALRDRPTALFCGNDVIALGVLNAAAALGLRIPTDLSVVGFDDIAMARWELFGLTTVRTDLQALAGRSCELLLSRISDPDGPARHVTVEAELVLRASHGPPPAP